MCIRDRCYYRLAVVSCECMVDGRIITLQKYSFFPGVLRSRWRFSFVRWCCKRSIRFMQYYTNTNNCCVIGPSSPFGRPVFPTVSRGGAGRPRLPTSSPRPKGWGYDIGFGFVSGWVWADVQHIYMEIGQRCCTS